MYKFILILNYMFDVKLACCTRRIHVQQLELDILIVFYGANY